MENKKSNLFKNTFVLVIITLVAVAALAVVNQITKGPIEQAEINQKAEAYKVVYADANEFSEIDGLDKMIKNSTKLFEDNGLSGCTVTDALAVKNSGGDTEGYIIASSSPNGYGGEIDVAIGIKDDKLTGFAVVNQMETQGYGAACAEDKFTSQFAGKKVGVLTAKAGGTADDEIDAISGATFTTNGVTNAVNTAVLFYMDTFGDGAPEVSFESNDADAASGATVQAQ